MDQSWAPPVIYFAATVLFWGYFWTPQPRLARFGVWTLLAGAVVHTVLIVSVLMGGESAITGVERTLMLFAWFTVVVFLAYEARMKVSVMGVFVAPLVFLLALPAALSSTIPGAVPEPGSLNPWVLTHITLVFAGEAIFTIAFVAGVLYLFEESRLKSKRMGPVVMKLPSITKLDRMNRLCLMLGFPILTLGLALGVVLAKRFWGVFLLWDYKVIGAVAIWLLFGALIQGRLVFGWRGRKAALGAILGFFVIILTLFAISYLPRMGP